MLNLQFSDFRRLLFELRNKSTRMCQGRAYTYNHGISIRVESLTIDSATSNTMTTHNLQLELQCLIIGQTDTFTVEINAEKRVNQLKKAIAAENKSAFQKIDIDAKDLILYSIIVEEDSIDETLPKVDVAKLKQMPASHKLSRYFSDPLPDYSVFAVIVQLPPGEYNWLSMPAVLMKSYCFLLPPLRAIRSDLTRPLSACY